MSGTSNQAADMFRGLLVSVVGGVLSTLIVRSLTTVRVDSEQMQYVGQTPESQADADGATVATRGPMDHAT